MGLAVRIVEHYEKGVRLRFGRVLGIRKPGLRFIIPVADVLPQASPADNDNADCSGGNSSSRGSNDEAASSSAVTPGAHPATS